MFSECVSIRHACDVVGDDPGPHRLVTQDCAGRELRGHCVDIVHEGLEEFPQDGLHLARHFQLLLVAVKVLLQKLFEQAVLLPDFRGEPDQRPAGGTNVVDGFGGRLIEVALRSFYEIGDDRIYNAANDLVNQPPFFEVRITPRDIAIL